MKTILAASDFSAQSNVALQRAEQLARQQGAQLALLHVVEGEEPPAPLRLLLSATPLQQRVAEARATLVKQAEEILNKAIVCKCHIETGKPFVAIIRAARQLEADLIVIAGHGRHSLRDLSLGTTGEKVVRKADRPVMVVSNHPPVPYRRVLVPTDFSSAAGQALTMALALAPGAHLDLLHCYEPWGESRLSLADPDGKARAQYQQQIRAGLEAAMTEWLRDIDLGERRVERHIRYGHPGTTVPQVARELAADLVAMGTEGRTGLPYVLLGSVAEHTLREAPCDVLTVRPSGFCFELP